jgi:hypothetical protein
LSAFTQLFEAAYKHTADGTIWFNPSSSEFARAYRDTQGCLRGTLLYNVIKDLWAFTDEDILHDTLARKCSWRPDDCLHFYAYPESKLFSFSLNAYALARGGDRYFDPKLLDSNKHWKWMLSRGWKTRGLDEKPAAKRSPKSRDALDILTADDIDLLDKLGESTDRWLLLGTYHEGTLKARRVEVLSYIESNDESPTHSGLGLHGGERWRYPEGSKDVYWWHQPSEEAESAVDAYLTNRGFSGLIHREMMDGSLEDEVSSGRISVPRYLRDMEKSSKSPYYKSVNESG